MKGEYCPIQRWDCGLISQTSDFNWLVKLIKLNTDWNPNIQKSLDRSGFEVRHRSNAKGRKDCYQDRVGEPLRHRYHLRRISLAEKVRCTFDGLSSSDEFKLNLWTLQISQVIQWRGTWLDITRRTVRAPQIWGLEFWLHHSTGGSEWINESLSLKKQLSDFGK